MFLSIEQIKESLKYLEQMGYFWGITFLKCKQLQLPVNNTIEISLESEIKDFLEIYYKPFKESVFFYFCFRLLRNNQDRWRNIQVDTENFSKNIYKNNLAQIFNHDIKTKKLGWKDNYIENLKSLQNGVIPVFHLAVWLYREKQWSSETTPENIIEYFIEDFLLNEQEISNLFDSSIPENTKYDYFLNNHVVTWKELQTIIGKPPDILPEEGILTHLQILRR